MFNCLRGFALLCALWICTINAFSQSSESNNPTPITTNHITGTIPARDLGDARQTNHYYYFMGLRGDVFINVVTQNFNGDIDIYTADGLKPKTKIVIYADDGPTETGRVVYMRQDERLILRVQGRTLLDDAATYEIKFAGTFGAIEGAVDDTLASKPVVTERDSGEVRVNSVGTIIPPVKKPEPKILIIERDKLPEVTAERKEAEEKTTPNLTKSTDSKETADASMANVTDSVANSEANETKNVEKDITVEISEEPRNTSAIVTISRVSEEDEALETSAESERATKELEKKKLEKLQRTKLVIKLKNGKTLEKRMSKISSFNVFDGVLKVVAIDGEVTKFSILDVESVSIQ
ncbi:MAG: hypothetical protein ACK5NT_06260 [Pyrinomonadaceae bacterium]